MNRFGAIFSISLLLLIGALGCEDSPTSVSSPRYSALSDSSFAVGDLSVIEADNFAGKVDVLPGNPGVVHVAVKKWAGKVEDLGQINVEMVEMQNGVRVTTTSPSGLKDVSVDLEITAPLDTRPTVRNVAGEINYHGRAEGECQFMVAAGNISLNLPADANVEVHLSVAAGSVQVDFPVDGQVSDNVVEGIIGTGEDGIIEAHVASGHIFVIRQ